MSPTEAVPPSLALATLRRDLKLAGRRRVEALLPLGFFLVAAGLFPIGVSPEPHILRQLAAGVIWVCALLATMISVPQTFAGDHADGSLEQMLLAPASPLPWVLGKVAAHWLTTALPLVLTAPLVGLMFDMRPEPLWMMVATLLLGTPVLSLLGALGAALTLGLRGGAALVLLLVLPLTIPALIFGTGAIGAADAGMPTQAHLSLLGALLILTALGVPPAIIAALRIALD